MAYTTAKISALVINLDQSPERLQFQQHQLAELKITMQRLPAMRTIDITDRDYEKWSNGWERKMRKAEVACFLSHKKAWQMILQYNQPMLILEDDALLSHQLPAILDSLILKNHIDYVNLETRQRRKLLDNKEVILTSDYAMRRLYQDRNGSAAYVLFPSGAHKLLARTRRQAPALADAFLSSAYDLSAWQVCPAAAIQTDQCAAYQLHQVNPFPSTITSANQSKPPANSRLDYWRFKYRRVAAQCRMGWRQCSVLGRATRLHVSVRTVDFLE
ncbi:glycosyltransferase family 25 protein [Neisseriaceae bacterium ESL0693]|nr:glycosyltransferase family 25 protein [Neisseriaceae bacterium ESL0693]